MDRKERKKLIAGFGAIIPYIDSACDAGGIEFTGYEDAEGNRKASMAREALAWLREARDCLKKGGTILMLTRGELKQLNSAAGNSTADDDWYRHQCFTAAERRNLLNVAEKVGFMVMLGKGAGPRKKGRPMKRSAENT